MTQRYIGTKQVQAWEQDKDGKPGYAVKYPDGYTSWSPKDTFEAAYLPQGHDATRVTPEMVDDFIVGHESTRLANHTVVLVRLRNGFTLIAESACVDAANYDHGVGEEYALKKAKNEVWRLLGFLLATARNGVNATTSKPLAQVYANEDCVYRYCPTPETCKASSDGCVINEGKR